ncbi:MAG TPA: thiamine pyrophosphate-binding protein, partial [Actinomycetota bacterium]|nr:thiamine pyrophosphate-binding protein [Actinomycetota bacterium]
MDKIASGLLVERLADWGVDTVFGLPGDGINGIMEGLRRHQDRVRFVLVHHEETAVLGTGHQQEVHLDRLFMDLAEYNMQISTRPRSPPWSTGPCAPAWPAGRSAELDSVGHLRTIVDALTWSNPTPHRRGELGPVGDREL